MTGAVTVTFKEKFYRVLGLGSDIENYARFTRFIKITSLVIFPI